MKKLLCPLALASVLFAGCAHQYIVTMGNGTRITASSKPKLEHGYYTFKDAQGRPTYISQGRVREITRGKLSEERSPFVVPPAK